MTVVCGLVLYARMPDAFSHPQFWAEDGTIFFLDAHSGGWRALLDPYSGYLHLIPRAVAWLAELLPYELIPEAARTWRQNELIREFRPICNPWLG